MRLKWETSNFSWVAFKVWTLALSIWIKVKGLRGLWNLATFSEQVDKALLYKRVVSLMCYFWEPAMVCDPVNSP
jgi:hypothetical protein